MERRSRWSFGFRANNTWFWQVEHPDGTQHFSDARLDSLADCLWDAAQHGYVMWDLAAERRHDPPAREALQ